MSGRRHADAIEDRRAFARERLETEYVEPNLVCEACDGQGYLFSRITGNATRTIGDPQKCHACAGTGETS